MDTHTQHLLSFTTRPEHPVVLQIRHGYSRALRRDGWWLEARAVSAVKTDLKSSHRSES